MGTPFGSRSPGARQSRPRSSQSCTTLHPCSRLSIRQAPEYTRATNVSIRSPDAGQEGKDGRVVDHRVLDVHAVRGGGDRRSLRVRENSRQLIRDHAEHPWTHLALDEERGHSDASDVLWGERWSVLVRTRWS